MLDPAPNAELLRSLGRLARGLSALFWGMPAALRPVADGFVPETGTSLAHRARPRQADGADQSGPQPVSVFFQSRPGSDIFLHRGVDSHRVGRPVFVEPEFRVGPACRDASRRNVATGNETVHRAQSLAAAGGSRVAGRNAGRHAA